MRGASAAARAALRLLVSACLLAAPARAAEVIEFYNAPLDHYFVTADPNEAAAIDSGSAGPGWARTGYTFGAGGPTPVCRFYGSQSPGPNSHFYTVLPGECEDLKQIQAGTPDTQKRWNFESLDFSSTVPASGACPASLTPVYRAYNNGFARSIDSNHRIVSNPAAIDEVVARGWKNEGVVMCAPPTQADVEADVVRFLEQATLGPTEALVKEVAAKGIAAWLDEQIALNVTRYTQHPPLLFGPNEPPCLDDPTPPITPEKYCQTNRGFGRPVQWEFYKQAKGPDQLRLRMAHVWHQILVVSGGFTYGGAESQQRYRDHAFGTFENLLYKYAISPQLGDYQNWNCNRPEHDGIKPNENFARELMQLFTIGVNELDEDGTLKRDTNGRPIPTYGQADIATLARILTGFSWPTPPGRMPGFCANGSYFVGDMEPYDEFHDTGPKSMLSGRISLPAGGGAMAEFRAALRALVDHPNTPPFISRQLIQKMVTSSPSPAYVARVAAVFRNNGNGVRGDLAAITKAILLDPEARGPHKLTAQYGRLLEPALYLTAMIRALDVTTDGVAFTDLGGSSNQSIFFPASVFNYYPADFTLLGTSIPAPEFGIYSTNEFRNRSNHANMLLFHDVYASQPFFVEQWGPRPYVANATGTPVPSLAAFLPDAGNAVVLVERLNRLFLHGVMSAGMRKTIVNAVNKVPATDPARRVKMALKLILPSLAYQIQK